MNRKSIDEIVKNKIRETNTLEFKRADTLYNLLKKGDKEINEFTKDITAIANSNGGTIIYGIQEYSKGNDKGKAECVVPIDKNKITVEWVEQMMNSRIQPRIQDYKIFEIDINENSFVLAIEIPQSKTIHQSNNKCYYKRFQYQSVKMDDWEVKTLINRYNKPIIIEKIYIQKKPDYLIKALNKLRPYSYELIIGVENQGNVMAKHLSFFLRIEKNAFKYIDFSDLKKNSFSDYFEIVFDNKLIRSIKFQGKEIEIGSEYEPILPNSWRILKSIPVTEDFFDKKIDFKVFISTESTFSEQNYKTNELEIVKTKVNLNK